MVQLNLRIKTFWNLKRMKELLKAYWPFIPSRGARCHRYDILTRYNSRLRYEGRDEADAMEFLSWSGQRQKPEYERYAQTTGERRFFGAESEMRYSKWQS